MDTKPRGALLSSRLDWIALEILLLFSVTVIYAVIIWQHENASAQTRLEAFSVTVGTVAPFSQFALICIVGLFELGGEIMLRFTHKIEQATAAGIEKGIAEGVERGIAEGIAQGRAEVYRAWHADWEKRRQAAVSKGLPFNEPPPPNPEDNGTR